MAKRRLLLIQTEKLLGSLLEEAGKTLPPVFDDDGVEKLPARPGVTFGERLRLAEVVTSYEVRRSKIEEDVAPSEADSILQEFHGYGSGKAPGRPPRKARPEESNGLAHGGRVPDPYS